MLLDRLKVLHNGRLLREISFHENLTIITSKELEGNKIGKSTVLRIINFCLGSDGKSIWLDPVKKEDNIEVKNFVLRENVDFILYLKKDERRIELKRSFMANETKGKQRIHPQGWINEEPFHGIKKYLKRLSEFIGHSLDKPSYSQLKNRVIKVDDGEKHNSLRYLSPWTPNDDYRLIYSSLFDSSGINDIRTEIEIKSEIISYKANKELILDKKEYIYYKERLDAIDLNLNRLYEAESNFEIKNPHLKEMERLKVVRREIVEESSKISAIDVKLDYNHRSIERFRNQKSDLDISLVESMYREVKNLIPGLQKSLEDVIGFYNSFQDNKINYLLKLQQEIELARSKLQTSLEQKLDSEKALLKALGDQGYLSDFIVLEKEIQRQKEERGRADYIVNAVQHINGEIKRLEGELEETQFSISEEKDDIADNIALFNKYFEDFSRSIFKEYTNSLKYDADEGKGIPFSIINGNKNTGEGNPRAESMIFDLAFVKYLIEKRKKFFYFSIQDNLEAVDEEKLKIIFKKIIENGIQVVISILRDKISDALDEELEDHIKLELSPDNKFFKL